MVKGEIKELASPLKARIRPLFDLHPYQQREKLMRLLFFQVLSQCRKAPWYQPIFAKIIKTRTSEH